MGLGNADLIINIEASQLKTFKESSKCINKIPFFGAFIKHGLSESNPWTPYIGNFKALDTFLGTKPGWGWGFPKFLNALFRGVGQVVFANNPLTGLIILLSLFWASPIVGLATLLAASTAILTAFVFRQEESSIYAGLTTYNAVLVGSVTASLWVPVYGQEITPLVWGFIILASAISVFVQTALGNLLGSFKNPLPPLTFAFNIVALLLFTCLMPSNLGPANPTPANSTIQGVAMELVQTLPEVNNTLLRTTREVTVAPLDTTLHYGLLVKGILLSFGQIYGVKNLVASVLMYFATLLYSPTLFFMSFMGATVGTIFGIVFVDAPYDTLYDGIWGFNGILSAIAVGGFFFVFTFHSFCTALVNVLLTIMIQHALAIAFGPLNLPFFTLPFVLSSLLFLQMTATGDNLRRVTNITWPEFHRNEYLAELKLNRPPPTNNTSDEIAEEKELVLKEVKVIMEETPKDVEGTEEK